jgi:TPR repeat protein
MITRDSFSDFVTGIHTHLFPPGTPRGMRLSDVRKVVADSLETPLSKLDEVLGPRPVPIDGALCSALAARFDSLGFTLPTQMRNWPFPKRFKLTSRERRAMWAQMLDLLMQEGKLDGALYSAYRDLEPYVLPAGDGNWFVCNGSPVPFELCAEVFGNARVINRPSDDSIANDTSGRSHGDALFHDGLYANRRGDKAKAFEQFKESAKTGHPLATFNVAWMLEGGEGVLKDLPEAVRQYEAAANDGVALAHHNLASILRQGSDEVPADIPRAITHYEYGVEHDVAASMECLARMYLDSNSTMFDRTKARDLLFKGARQGDRQCINLLGCVLEEDGLSSRDVIFKLYREAARSATKRNDVTPIFNLGVCYLEGKGVSQNVRHARRLFEIAAAAGDPDAAWNLGYIYAKGLGTARDHSRAVTWLERASEKDNPGALNFLGSLYLRGDGCEPDPERALTLFKRAEVLGSVDATVNRAQCFVFGLGVKRSITKALELLNNAENRGYKDTLGLRRQWECMT